MIDEVQDTVALLVQFQDTLGGRCDHLTCMDADLLFGVCVFITANQNFFRNPHTRCSRAANILNVIQQTDSPIKNQLSGKIKFGSVTSQFLVSSLIEVFVDIQKADYHTRIDMRTQLMQQLDTLLKEPDFQRRLLDYSTAMSEKFLKFIHLLLAETAWLLEEGMSYLAEIKKRETRGESSAEDNAGTSQAPPSGERAEGSSNAAPVEGEAEGDEEDEVADAQAVESVEQLPMERLKVICQSLNKAGLRAVTLLLTIIDVAGKTVATSPLVTPQIITTLNCCISHLTGPRALQLKVSSFEAYMFQPRELLANIAQILLSLYDSAGPQSQDELVNQIVADERYSPAQTYPTAARLIKREGLLQQDMYQKFQGLVNKTIQAAAANDDEAEFLRQMDDEIPDDYKDAIMCNVMTDPVRLPTSGKIMDRKNIERHLMSEDFDPFTRKPLKKEDLIAEPKLKQTIEEFICDLKRRKTAAAQMTD